MILHEGDVSDDIKKYPKIGELTHIFHIWQFYWNGAYSTGCYQYLMCQCELLL